MILHRPLLFAVLFTFMIPVTWAGESVRGHLTPMPGTPAAPGFVLEDMDGQVHRLEQYRDQVVVVNFWATWCPPCRDELPSLQRLWERMRDEGVVVLGINIGEDADSIFLFTADYPVDFPLLLDEDSAVIEAWPVVGIPTTYIVDRQGRLTYRAIGAREFDEPAIRATLRGLLED
jgi:peroxiredoxin